MTQSHQATGRCGPDKEDTTPPKQPLAAPEVGLWAHEKGLLRCDRGDTGLPPRRMGLPHNREWVSLRSPYLLLEAYAIWWNQAHHEEINSLLLERLAPTGAQLLIDRARKHGCALLHFDFVYYDLVRLL
jgi:hypothetical protein